MLLAAAERPRGLAERLRSDPAFKLACARLPDSGLDLCSQPTMSSYEAPPASVALDIDDTLDVMHGHQQLEVSTKVSDGPCGDQPMVPT